MTTILITALFISSTLLALGAIVATLHAYGRTALGLYGDLARCPSSREVTVSQHKVVVTCVAIILRPEFGMRDQPTNPAERLSAAA